MKKNIFLENVSRSNNYKGHGMGKYELPFITDKDKHIARIQNEFNIAIDQIKAIKAKNPDDTKDGYFLDFSSQEKYDLISKSLESEVAGVKILNITVDENDITKATVYIPEKKEEKITKKFDAFSKTIEDIHPKNEKLVQSINSIKASTLESFWTSEKEAVPEKNPVWCELWLRYEQTECDSYESVISSTKEKLERYNIQKKEQFIKFPERMVLLIKADKEQLEALIQSCQYIAEIQKAREPNVFYTNLLPKDRNNFITDLLQRCHIQNNNICVCLLDTGINENHSLLSQNILTNKSVVSNDGRDHKGHGSEMAGIILYNDLEYLLTDSEKYYLSSKIESVKILPDGKDNEPDLYGYITDQAVTSAEIENPTAKRIICMAITAPFDNPISGAPTSWSAAIDSMCFNFPNPENKRLFIVSAGNVKEQEIEQQGFPDANINHNVENPAQSWNALTVGAYSGKDYIDDPAFKDFKAVVEKDNLSPYSSTSMLFERKWPVKPEVLFDGGNMCTNDTDFDHCENLSLLTTSKDTSKLSTIWATSAATAQASWFASRILDLYPDSWPETIRGLIVHSADWTKRMKQQFLKYNTSKTERATLLRTCGYGKPDLRKALECLNNSVNMICQDELQPFKKRNGNIIMNEMRIVTLPYPKELLQSLGPEKVKLKITLSYFIEPAPGNRGWKDKYTYSSFGLHFDVKNPLESEQDFINRINHLMNEDTVSTQSVTNEWFLGPKNRDKGSIHSDYLETTATELSEMDKIAIYPISGWWKNRAKQKRYEDKVRYSLIITISTKKLDVDLYTPIMTAIGNVVQISV